MNFQNYKELLISSLSQTYKIDSFYLGEEYDIAGTFSKNDDGFEQKEACLVSFCNDENFVLSELQKLPEITLSGADGFSRNRRSVVLRVFVMQDVSFELVKKNTFVQFQQGKKKPVLELCGKSGCSCGFKKSMRIFKSGWRRKKKTVQVHGKLIRKNPRRIRN